MRRLCERPGCGAPAEVSYGIDRVGCTVWVDNRAVPERELAGRLCRRHADALVVPRGWTVDDRREAVPKLFRVRDMPDDERPRAGRARRGRVAAPPSEPSPPLQFPSRSTAEQPDTVVASVPPASAPPTPVADESAADETSVAAATSEATTADATSDLVYEPDDSHGPGHVEDAGEDSRDDEETRAFPWSPRLVGAPEPDDPSGPVFGRLLGRAFGRTSEGE